MTATKTKKVNFTGKKEAFQLVDIDVDKIFVSIKEPYGTKNALKYFIEYNDDAVIRSLCLQLPQMTGYAKKCNENVPMFFRVNNKQTLKNYNKIWEKSEKLIRIDFESKPVYGDDDKYIMLIIRLNIFTIKRCLKKNHHASFYQ